MRKIFIDELILAAKKNKNIILVVNDLGYNVVEPFAKKFPKQFYNVGVAEQNMMGIAAGLAIEGHHVFVYSIGNFPTFRCAEQIRNDIDYHNLPVTIVNVGGGVGYGNLGYSHHSIQDYGLMRLFPNILISSPGDNLEIKACIKYLLKNPQPSYLRLSKTKGLNLHKTIPTVRPGSWTQVVKNKKTSLKKTFLTTGNTLHLAKKIILDKKFKDYSIYSIPLWGMKYKKLQIKLVKNWDKVIVLEDHLEDGGLASWIKESNNKISTLSNISSSSINRNVVGKVGSEEYLLNKFFFKNFVK